MALAAAAVTMAMAISGTLIFLVLSRQRPSSGPLPAADPSPASPPPCIVDPKRRREKKAARTGKRRVRFAERVAERYIEDGGREGFSAAAVEAERRGGGAAAPAMARVAMPANWVALYGGMLRDRHRRVVCSY